MKKILIALLISSLAYANIPIKRVKGHVREKVLQTYHLQNVPASVVNSSLNGTFGVELRSVNEDLVIIGYKEEVEKVRQLISKIDRKKRQVLIKANIIETSSNLFDRIGFNWKLKQEDSDISLSKILNLGGIFLGVDIDALKDKGDLNIRSIPSILVTDGKVGQLKVTEETLLTESKDKAPYFYEAGIILEVKPKIIVKGYKEYVQLEIFSEVSNFKLGNKGKQKSTLKTDVMVLNHKASFIGGLNQLTSKNNVSKTPILGDIPIFGTFFTKKNKGKEKRDVYIEVGVEISE